MKRNFIIILTVAAVMTACGTKDSRTTTLVSQYANPEYAPDYVEVLIGNAKDTVINFSDGKLEATIPADKTVLSYIISEGQPMQFISDGSTLTFDFAEKTVTSSNKNGPNAHLQEFLKWQEEFMDDYQEKVTALPEEEQDAFMEESLEAYNDNLKKVIKDNKDNVLALLCIASLNQDDSAEMLELLNSLDDNMRATDDVKELIEAQEAALNTVEGKPFVDFTVVQDPEDPENTTVKLSDYVGKGKYILADFWASWCGPCKDEMPYIKAAYEKFHGPQFDMVSIAISDEPADTKKAAEELGITWNQIVNAQVEPAYAYGIQYIPHVILFGPDGTILKRGLRGEEIESALSEVLDK